MKREVAAQEASVAQLVRRAFGHGDSDDDGDGDDDELNKYFILPRLCLEVAPLRREDLVDFNTHCTKCLDTSAANINRHLDRVSALQQIDGGHSIFQHYATDDSVKTRWDFPVFYASFLDLLGGGIARLNAAGVLHNDVKEDNVVFDGARVRLIDWDRAGASVVVPKRVIVASAVNRPPAYMLNSIPFQQLLLERDNTKKTNEELTAYLMEKLAATPRPHAETEETVAAFFGVENLLGLYREQILDVLDTFREEDDTGAMRFDIGGYTAVLEKNMDVYGWLFVNAFCLVPGNAMAIFEQSSLQNVGGNYGRVISLVRAYLYTPELSGVYDVPELVEHFRDAAALDRRAPSPSSSPRRSKRMRR